MDFLIGRQAILKANGKTFGYELLYRENKSKNVSTTSFDGEVSTKRVIINAFLNIGLDRIAKKGRLFINFTKDLITERVFDVLPKERIVVEVLEDVKADKEVVEALKEAKKEGYLIALDDFVFEENLSELVKLADIIKVDFLELSKEKIKKEVELYKPYKLKLLAEKVETKEDFEFAKQLGFEYFQGFFFEKPTIEVKKDIAPYQTTIIKAIKVINGPNTSKEELIKLISGDIYLSTKLLSLINSPFYGLKRKVTSIKQAVDLLGEKKIKEWLNIIYMSKLAEEKPQELAVLATIRAKFAQNLSDHFKLDKEKAYFTGLFSLMDTMLSKPMNKILKELNFLDEEIRNALLNKPSPYLNLLNFIKQYEKANFEDAQKISTSLNIDTGCINSCYLDAVEFADSIYS
ncbi:EAL and HDOD domain-containing protein [Hippea jasoniae]|uniref:EAL and HDOD domain-containing protein n=1 Tax=Hippea jasoniae TaxID=944479 RepID=UPI000552B242|nr:HDOD domain-containing protein [Hippea jasoniae]